MKDTNLDAHQYISQETRNEILQVLLGHPSHCASIAELDYYIPMRQSEIEAQLDNLVTNGVLNRYHYKPSEEDPDCPSEFWGFTAFGVQLLEEVRYHRLLPILRALHDACEKSTTVKRHQDAPRPSLPPEVSQYLSYDEPSEESIESLAAPTDVNYEPIYSTDDDVTGDEGDRTFDDLF